MKTFFCLLALFILHAAPGKAADEPMLKRLAAADDARVAATLAADRTRMSAIYSDDLHYAHSSGVVDTKAAYLDAVVSGRTKYVAMDYDDRQFTFPAPGVALMTGRVKVKIGKAEGIAELKLSFLAVWREEQGQWRFLAWQSCKLPEPSTGPK